MFKGSKVKNHVGMEFAPAYYFRNFLYLVILLFLTSSFSLLCSCSNQKEISLRYKMEKKYFKAEEMRRVLFINLKAAAPDDYKRVIQSYQQVVDLASSAGQTSSQRELFDIAASSQLRIAELYNQQKELDLTERALEKVLEKYPESIPQQKNAQLGLAQIYERKNQREKAVEAYHKLLDNYPPVLKKKFPDPNILPVPNHLIQLFSSKEEKSQRENEFEQAKKYYQNLIQTYPNTQISFSATLGLAGAYQLQDRWAESIVILETAKDSTGQIPGPVLLQIGNIYYDQLKDEKNALSTFQRVIESSPDSSSKAEAQIKLGIIYFQKKDYPKAKEELSKLKRFYPRVGNLLATSQFLIAQIYEKSGEWERALNEYNWLMINYFLTPEGLEAPLRIAGYYQKENPSLASEYFEKGVKHYDGLLDKYKDKPFVSTIESYKAKLYLLKKDWNMAVSSLQRIIDKYRGTDAGLSALLTLLRIYRVELKDEAKSKEILARIESDYPGLLPDTLNR